MQQARDPKIPNPTMGSRGLLNKDSKMQDNVSAEGQDCPTVW